MNLWHLFDAETAWARTVLLTFILGLIVAALRGATVKAPRFFAGWRERRRREKIFRYMETTKPPNALYEVSEIATALKLSAKAVLRSLLELLQEQKVRRFNVDEIGSGLWGVGSMQPYL
jgi:hypothetical protein